MNVLSTQRPVAIVTGGSRGIGRAVVVALASQGWDVTFSYVTNTTAADKTCRIAEGFGGRVVAVKSDVASHHDIKQLFKRSHSTFGRLDALVNNAAVVNGRRSIMDSDPEHLRSVFEANVIGSFLCVAEAARAMSTTAGGSGGVIVNVSSVAARLGGILLEAHYAASKGAVDSMTLAAAKELAPHGIRVNSVRPGLIDTEIHEAHGGEEHVARVGPTVPLGRAGTAEEVAEVIAFLCGPSSSYVHGSFIDVSGGR